MKICKTLSMTYILQNNTVEKFGNIVYFKTMRKTSTLKVQFGKNLKEYRKKAGLTQEQLAEKTGLSSTAISGIETANSFPSYNNLVAFINVLNIPAYKLFVFADDIIKCDIDEKEIFIKKIFEDLSDDDKDQIIDFAQFLKSKNH